MRERGRKGCDPSFPPSTDIRRKRVMRFRVRREGKMEETSNQKGRRSNRRARNCAEGERTI